MKRSLGLSLLTATCATLACAAIPSRIARADIFELSGPGELRGELLNKDEKPRTKYIVRTPLGGKVTLEASQVKRVVRQSAMEIAYETERLKYLDTVDAQWALAEWCREKSLPKQRKAHLERVVALDPEHDKARRGLGYVKSQGRWITQEQLKADNGWVKYKGQWRLVQDVELMEQQRKAELAEKDWAQKITRWRKWLDTDEKYELGESSLLGITDPIAARPLALRLSKETDREMKLLFVDALCRLPESSGLDAVLETSMADLDEEVRIVCLERLSKANYRPAVSYFIGQLKSKDNVLVNRAAAGLAHMKDPIAIEPLIAALVTTHKYKIIKGNPNQTSATFGSGAPGGFSFGGGGEEIVTRSLPNKHVLDALILLSGGVNFDFDVEAWKYWFASQKKPATINARRD